MPCGDGSNPGADQVFLDTGVCPDSGFAPVPGSFSWNSSSIPGAATGGDNVQQAAVRAQGVDPATGQWIAPQYAKAGQDPTQVATQAAAAAQTFYDQELVKATASINSANQKCGGFLADLLNPFSPNIDPSQWNCQVAQAIKSINWTGVLALVIVLAVLATVHQAKEVV